MSANSKYKQSGWRDSLKWGICVRPGTEPDQGARNEFDCGSALASEL